MAFHNLVPDSEEAEDDHKQECGQGRNDSADKKQQPLLKLEAVTNVRP